MDSATARTAAAKGDPTIRQVNETSKGDIFQVK
jgi:hypothetical protein